MLKMLTLFISIYFWSHFIKIKREMYCLRARLTNIREFVIFQIFSTWFGHSSWPPLMHPLAKIKCSRKSGVLQYCFWFDPLAPPRPRMPRLFSNRRSCNIQQNPSKYPESHSWLLWLYTKHKLQPPMKRYDKKGQWREPPFIKYVKVTRYLCC